jgi:hypothetical protein
LSFNDAVLFPICEHHAAEVVRNHDLEVGLRLLVEVDGHETLELLAASLLFEVLLILLHALDFLHQIEIAHLLYFNSFASHEALEHLTWSRFQLKIINLLKLPFIDRINIAFGGLQIKNKDVTSTIGDKVPTVGVEFYLSNKPKIQTT